MIFLCTLRIMRLSNVLFSGLNDSIDFGSDTSIATAEHVGPDESV